MENIAETEPTHPHTHFTHFAALWFGEGPLPRGRERFAAARAEKEARAHLARDNWGAGCSQACVQTTRGRMQERYQ